MRHRNAVHEWLQPAGERDCRARERSRAAARPGYAASDAAASTAVGRSAAPLGGHTTLSVCVTKPLEVSPFEALHGTKPKLKSLRTWGCIAHVRVSPESRPRKEKLMHRAEEWLMLSYSQDTKD